MTATGPSWATATESWHSMTALYELIGAELERELDEAVELSVIEYTVLAALSGEHGHMRLEWLADAATISPGELTYLVDRLEERGLLSQVLCASDGGGVCAELTGAGRRRQQWARSVHDRTLRRVMAGAKQRPELARLVVVLQGAGLLPLSAAS